MLGVLFLVTGAVGVVYHAREIHLNDPFANEAIWVLLIRVLAIVGAVFLLRAHNWARWLLLVWMAYHVVLSGLHSASKLIVHAMLLVVIAYFLFHRRASAYFHNNKPPEVGKAI